MAGIKNIRDLYKKVGEKGLREVLEKDIRVTEKFDAYRFAFEKNSHNYKIFFYGKNGKTQLTKIDRTINDLYEGAINYIDSLPSEIKRSIPARHRFGFSWFPTNKPLNTEYDRRPKNGLVLTDITVRDRMSEVTRDVKESQVFDRWAQILGVEANTPVFEGALDKETVDSLVEMAKQDYTLTSLNESAVYTTGKLNNKSKNIEALVIESGNELLKIADVIKDEKKPEKRGHLFDILLLDICEHISGYNISTIKPAALRPDDAYIEVVSEIFNDFVEKKGTDFLSSSLDRPAFLEKSGRFNCQWIKNPKTLVMLEKDSRYEYLFSVFLANLKKPKYPSGLLNEAVVNRFNNKIEEIDRALFDDYSFLEFNTILKEGEDLREKPQAVDVNPDMSKGVLLLQTFFNSARKGMGGKDNVNVILCDCGRLNNSVLREAERLHQYNGLRTILFHNRFAAQRDFPVSEDTVKKFASKFVEDHNDIFIGYRVLELPFLSHMFKILGEPFNIKMLSCFENYADMKMCQDELKASCGEGCPPLKIVSPTNASKKKFYDSLEKESYKDFQSCTPSAVHLYWTELKSSFDKYTYK